MFIESRAIDDRATAGSFRTAHQRYASDTDTWFDGTPQSIDGRIARARRLVHLAKESVARRGIQTDRLAAISSLEADIRALTALRHDLLTGAIDRELPHRRCPHRWGGTQRSLAGNLRVHQAQGRERRIRQVCRW